MINLAIHTVADIEIDHVYDMRGSGCGWSKCLRITLTDGTQATIDLFADNEGNLRLPADNCDVTIV